MRERESAGLPDIWKQAVPSASTKCFKKQRSSYLRIHLANRHTDSVEIKHRYSQTVQSSGSGMRRC